MFFLRCAFWLSIVYSSMSWTSASLATRGPAPHDARTYQAPAGTQDRIASFLAAGQAVTSGLAQRAGTAASEYCARHAADCLDDAARLTALFAAPAPTNDRESAALTSDEADSLPVPLPVPDPRRHVGGAKVAPTS